jgi:hypothetical protein
MSTKPGVALQEVPFEEGPYILQRGENFYLRYRIALNRGGEMTLRMAVDAREVKDKGYYYFIGPISRPERGNAIERPLALDGLTQFAQKRAVYWLNPDGSEIPLEIKQQPEHLHE